MRKHLWLLGEAALVALLVAISFGQTVWGGIELLFG